MKNTTRWFINKVKASTWLNRPAAPDLELDRTEYLSLADARRKIQEAITTLCTTKNIEKIEWFGHLVKISYNYLDDGTWTQEVVSYEIEQLDKWQFKLVSIGSKLDG